MGLKEQMDKRKKLMDEEGIRATFKDDGTGIQVEAFVNATEREVRALVMSLISMSAKAQQKNIVEYTAELVAEMMINEKRRTK